MTILLVLFPDRRVINLVPDDAASREFWFRLLQVFGGTGVSGQRRRVRWASTMGLIVRNPRLVTALLIAAIAHLKREGLGPRFVGQLLCGRVRGFNLVMHNFMSHDELAKPRRAIVEERLAACSFRGAVKRDGVWVAEPMCTMNAGHRDSIYAEQISLETVKSRMIPG